MIRPDVLGELKDGAAGLVTLSELLASRRIGPKAIAGALPSAGDACAGIASAISVVASDVLSACGDDASARREVRATFDRAETSVRALEVELAAAIHTPGEAKTRLVLERAANAASSNVASSLFVAELFAFASSPRVVSIHVADVLGFGPSIADGPQVIRATLDAPPGPVATTDARLLRALVELAVQIVAAAGVSAPHVQVTGSEQDGARIRVGTAPTPLPPSSMSFGQRRAPRAPPPVATLSTRRLAWFESAPAIARAAAAIAGADVTIDPGGRGVTIVF